MLNDSDIPSVSAETAKNPSTPYAKLLIKTYASKLQPFISRYRHIAYCFHDEALQLSATRIFIALGFKVHSTVSNNADQLMKHIPIWLQHKNLVLLNYTNGLDDTMNLINLLRGIKRQHPAITFSHLIPIFYGTNSGKKEMGLFRIMGSVGIDQVIFLTKGIPVEANIEEILKQLVERPDESSAPPKRSLAEELDEKLKKYYFFLDKGKISMKQGRFKEAIGFFSSAIELNPDYTSLLHRGDAYYKNSEFLEALGDYRDAAKLESSLSEPFSKAAACCFQIAQEQSLDEAGGKEEAAKLTGDALAYLRHAKGLIDDYLVRNKNLPEKNLLNPYEHIINAIVLADVGKLDLPEMKKELEEMASEVVEKVGGINYFSSMLDIETRINYAILLTRQREYCKAETILRKVVQDSPIDAVPAFNNFAVELRKNGQYGKAFEIYKELLEHPQIPDREIIVENMKNAGLYHGRMLREGADCKQAIAVYRSIIENKPLNREWVFCELAMTYLEISDLDNACNVFMEALYLEPDIMSKKPFKNYQKLAGLKKDIMKKLS